MARKTKKKTGKSTAKKTATSSSKTTKKKSPKKNSSAKSPKKSAASSAKKFTFAHVTHEAVEQIGGIGAVLEGLMISPVYQQRCKRSILVGPLWTHAQVDPTRRLGDDGKVLYSSIDNIDTNGLGDILRPIEWAFDVKIVYGTRKYDQPSQGRKGDAEVILIDVSNVNGDRLNLFKLRLYETFGLDSWKYESAWDYEEYVRLAEPAYYALRALLPEKDLPCVLFSHEFMGMPAALKAIMDGSDNFRTVYHAHECPTARRLVEDDPGHDTMFYNVLDSAREKGLYLDDVFGSQDHALRHAFVKRAHLCDGIIAVGDRTRDELKFLSNKFDDKQVHLVYNGLPTPKVDMRVKNRARKMLTDYSKALLGYEPDVLMTHVTRPVISKALWRDLRVCHELDAHLARKNQKGVLYILTSAGGVRRPSDISSMHKQYNWPRNHRYGFPDLVGPEEQLNKDIEVFNKGHKAIQVVLVNQFGWTQKRIGPDVPKDMTFAELRCATDVEFGMAVYEPFGISPLEPLGCGAICVISSACGCEGFIRHVAGGLDIPNVISPDYSPPIGGSLDEKRSIGWEERDEVEFKVAAEVAAEVAARLPKNDKERKALVESGKKLVSKMGWDQVVEDGLFPMLEEIMK